MHSFLPRLPNMPAPARQVWDSTLTQCPFFRRSRRQVIVEASGAERFLAKVITARTGPSSSLGRAWTALGDISTMSMITSNANSRFN